MNTTYAPNQAKADPRATGVYSAYKDISHAPFNVRRASIGHELSDKWLQLVDHLTFDDARGKMAEFLTTKIGNSGADLERITYLEALDILDRGNNKQAKGSIK